jgi:transposase
MPQSGRPPRLGKEQQEAVRRAIEQAQDERDGGRIRGEEIRQLLHEQFHVDYSLNGVYHLLERLGMSWISARAISPQADLLAQAAFKKMFALQVQSVVPPHVTSDQIDIRFQDEMRIGQRGTQTRLWARKGTRPRVVRQQQSESAYIFGAFCPAQDSAAGVVLPHANAEAMGHHLRTISEAVPAGRHAILVLDRAGWHTTLKLPKLANVSLLPLPTGSPELNPAEQVWQQLRDRHLANRCFESYEQIVDACCDAWNAFTTIPDAIRSLCSRSWANLNQQAVT